VIKSAKQSKIQIQDLPQWVDLDETQQQKIVGGSISSGAATAARTPLLVLVDVT
jgi:hypothetical protein